MSDNPKQEPSAPPEPTGDAPLEATDGRVAFYQTAAEARTAVKLLTNSGFDSTRVFVLCTDEKRREEFRSRLLPAGGPQLNTAPSVVGVAGSFTGIGLLGGAGLIVGWPVAVAGAGLGALVGGAIGVMLGAGTYSDDETKRLSEIYEQQLEAGQIAVVVAAGPEDDASRMQHAEELLVQAESQ